MPARMKASTYESNGAGMCFRDEPLEVGDELRDGDGRYMLERVQQPRNPHSFGHAWAKLTRT
jgi:hypothetical protein